MVQSIQGGLPALPLELSSTGGASTARSQGVASARVPCGLEPANRAEKSSGIDFAKSLTNALSEATAAEKTANQAAQNFANGDGSIHEVMIAQEKASVSVRYALTLKNKAIEAYRELMNTPI